MTQYKKLEEIIKKVEKNGYLLPNRQWKVWEYDNKAYEVIIFSHKFLKVLFGKKQTQKIKPKNICVWSDYCCSCDFWSENEFIDYYGLEKLTELQKYNKVSLCKYNKRKVSSYWESKIINKGWIYHAQQLVILPEEKRVDYLYDYLKGE